MEKTKKSNVIHHVSVAKVVLAILGGMLFIGLAVAVVFIVSKIDDDIVVDDEYAQKYPLHEDDVDVDFGETLAELGLPEDAGLDDVYDRLVELGAIGGSDTGEEAMITENEDSKEDTERYLYPKTNFLTSGLFEEDGVAPEFPYSFFPDYTYRSANLVEKTVKEYFDLISSETIEFMAGSLKNDSFKVRVGTEEYKVVLDVSEVGLEKEVNYLTIFSPNNKEIFSYDGRFYYE